MATKCSGEEARRVAEYLEIVDKERSPTRRPGGRLEDQWVKWLRKDFKWNDDPSEDGWDELPYELWLTPVTAGIG